MINWFEDYDNQTYLQPYSSINYTQFNPLSTKDTDQSYFKQNYGFELQQSQFQNYLANSENDLKKLYDPLSQICISHVIKQLNMIKTVFETEGLLGMTDKFSDYCDKILDFVFAEKFYIFTSIHMIQTKNPKTFYRERSFKSLLRIFYFLANLKEVIEEKTFGKDLNMDSIKELQQYLLGLFEIHLNKLEAYQYISPQIILVCQKSNIMIEHMIAKEIHGEAIVKSLENKLQEMYDEALLNVNGTIQQALGDISKLIKQEFRHGSTSRERKDTNGTDRMRQQQYNQNESPRKTNNMMNVLGQGIGAKLVKRENSKQNDSQSPDPPYMFNHQNTYKPHNHKNSNNSPTSGTNTITRGIFTVKDQDQLTVAKSMFGKTKPVNKLQELMVKKIGETVSKNQDQMNQQIKEDQNIDLDKIKKYFENVVNERHYLDNYGKAKMRNQEGVIAPSAAVQSSHQQRQSDVMIAKKFFKQGMTKQMPNHFREAWEKTRISNLDKIMHSQRQHQQNNYNIKGTFSTNNNDILEKWRKSNFRGSNTDLLSSENLRQSIGTMIFQNVQREKSGVVKEHFGQIDYRNHENADEDDASMELDIKEFIPIRQGSVKQSTILDNPIYKQSPFYPLGNDKSKISSMLSNKFQGMMGGAGKHTPSGSFDPKQKQSEQQQSFIHDLLDQKFNDVFNNQQLNDSMPSSNLINDVFKHIKGNLTDQISKTILLKNPQDSSKPNDQNDITQNTQATSEADQQKIMEDTEALQNILSQFMIGKMRDQSEQKKKLQKQKEEEDKKQQIKMKHKERIKEKNAKKIKPKGQRRFGIEGNELEMQLKALGKMDPTLLGNFGNSEDEDKNQGFDFGNEIAKNPKLQSQMNTDTGFKRNRQMLTKTPTMDIDDDMMINGNIGKTPDEFSDESLFSEENLQELITKKNSLIMRNSTLGESFGQVSAPNFKGLQKSQILKDDQNFKDDTTPDTQTNKGMSKGDLLYSESQKHLNRTAGHQGSNPQISNNNNNNSTTQIISSAFNPAQCVNFDQIASLKNHDGVKRKHNVVMKNTVTQGGALNNLASDRRPVKYKDYNLLKLTPGNFNSAT